MMYNSVGVLVLLNQDNEIGIFIARAKDSLGVRKASFLPTGNTHTLYDAESFFGLLAEMFLDIDRRSLETVMSSPCVNIFLEKRNNALSSEIIRNK